MPLIVIEGSVVGVASPGSLPVVVCYVGDSFGGVGPTNADLVVSDSEIDAVLAQVRRAPIASTTLAAHLRTTPVDDIEHGLAAESAIYSLLQAGPEFASWRADHPAADLIDSDPTVQEYRDGPTLEIRLNRPHRHNAITSRLRDELHAALSRALADDTVEMVRLVGRGPSFCSGGDLDEFGSRPDVATAHAVRTLRSPARRIHQLRDRVEVHVHGSTLGGGIEMAAFAQRIVASPETRIALPEIGLGLIPGAGGTVSIPRRVGRQRTAAIALTGHVIHVATALRWGLIDEIDESEGLTATRR